MFQTNEKWTRSSVYFQKKIPGVLVFSLSILDQFTIFLPVLVYFCFSEGIHDFPLLNLGL